MQTAVPLSELNGRMKRFRVLMDAQHPDWEIALIISKINLYYFTGTIQDGILLVPRAGEACFWVRRSFERAVDESFFPHILPMRSYRDAARFHLPSSGDCRSIFHSGNSGISIDWSCRYGLSRAHMNWS